MRERVSEIPNVTPSPSPAEGLKTPLRKRTAAETSEAASERLDLAIAAVEAILRDSNARHSDKLAAAAFIRDTAHGKPGQSIDVTARIGIVEIVMEAAKMRKTQDLVIEHDTTNGKD